MTKTETIDYKTLKTMMKLSITINLELGFYISYTQDYIVIDRWENKCKQYQRTYIFNHDELYNILTLVHAYSKLHKRPFQVW